eukprot:GHUV01027492.1.p1 GENE.GHUV01027492.1~~GHUV01027492.1.p1  ORF type:complete len:406 (+),score=160.74 GHUV01027492.1:634-1851(+)
MQRIDILLLLLCLKCAGRDSASTAVVMQQQPALCGAVLEAVMRQLYRNQLPVAKIMVFLQSRTPDLLKLTYAAPLAACIARQLYQTIATAAAAGTVAPEVQLHTAVWSMLMTCLKVSRRHPNRLITAAHVAAAAAASAATMDSSNNSCSSSGIQSSLYVVARALLAISSMLREEAEYNAAAGDGDYISTPAAAGIDSDSDSPAGPDDSCRSELLSPCMSSLAVYRRVSAVTAASWPQQLQQAVEFVAVKLPLVLPAAAGAAAATANGAAGGQQVSKGPEVTIPSLLKHARKLSSSTYIALKQCHQQYAASAAFVHDSYELMQHIKDVTSLGDVAGQLQQLGAGVAAALPVAFCCNNPGCMNEDGCSEAELGSRCKGCMSARYCGRECQKEHWKLHKVVCKSRAAA